MRTFILAAAFAGAASAGLAGSLDAPVMEPEVIVEETTESSTDGIVFALITLAVIAAAVSN